ncbi:PadR family transcriptional regulator [bacterium]|nr:PadR family transcriptional regulator [bacterium]
MIELLILYIILKRDYTMYSIQKRITDIFAPFTNPSFGAIKPALKRLGGKECLTSRKIMSDGGKLSVYYEITKTGVNELKRLILEELSENPHQFLADARVKLSCADCLDKDERERLFFSIKSKALQFKNYAQNIMNDEYKQVGFYQKIILDNTVCEYTNFISVIEGLEKDNVRNSQ